MTNDTEKHTEETSGRARHFTLVLELWWLLREQSKDTQRLRDLLVAIAEFPLTHRFPLFGVLEFGLLHADAKIRAGCVRALAGATGPLAWKRLIAALGDKNPSVRSAAIASMLHSAKDDPGRLVHAVFHRNPAVRREIARQNWLNSANEVYVHLIFDSACQDIAAKKLLVSELSQNTVRLTLFAGFIDRIPNEDLWLILRRYLLGLGCRESFASLLRDCVREGVIDVPTLDRLLLSDEPALDFYDLLNGETFVSVPGLNLWLARALSELTFAQFLGVSLRGKVRDQADVRHMLQTIRSRKGIGGLHAVPSADHLDQLLDSVWPKNGSEGGSNGGSNGGSSGEVLAELTPLWCELPPEFASQQEPWIGHFPRLVAAIYWASHRHGTWLGGAEALCAKLEPWLLTAKSLSRERLNQILDGFMAEQPGKLWAPIEKIRGLIRKQSRQFPGIHLRLIAALASFVPECQLALVIDAVGFEPLVRAIRNDPRDAVWLLSRADDPSLCAKLLDAVGRQDYWIEIASQLVFRLAPTEFSALIDNQPAGMLARLAMEVARLDHQYQGAREAEKLEQAADVLAKAIAGSNAARNRLAIEWPINFGHESPFSVKLWAKLDEFEQAARLSESAAPQSTKPPADVHPIDLADAKERIPLSKDVGQLVAFCASADANLVEDATLRLLELGQKGIDGLGELLRRNPPVACAVHIAWTVPFWPRGIATDLAVDLFQEATLGNELRFVLGLGLHEHQVKVFEPLMEIARSAGHDSWFTPDYWERLKAVAPSDLEYAKSLIGASNHEKDVWATIYLALQTHGSPDVWPKLLERLVSDPETFSPVAAGIMWNQGFVQAFPVLMLNCARDATFEQLPLVHSAQDANELITMTLTCNTLAFDESRLLQALIKGQRNGFRVNACRRLILESGSNEVRGRAALYLQGTIYNAAKFNTVLNAFRWGIRASLKLLGRKFRIRMLGTDDLGYMAYGKSIVYVSIVPVLASHRNGVDLVKALILHELGHHIYHDNPEHADARERAVEENLKSLLNLVCDEHLERNLRHTSADYGHKLKRLAAYAFQHQPRELQIDQLLAQMGPRSFDVLSSCKLKPARRSGAVIASTGQVLRKLEQAGSSFARFFRALRMGLGNRHRDPKVDQALALFGGRFRHSTAQQQLDIARKLREIFADESNLLDAFNDQSAVPPEDIIYRAAADGIRDEDLQAALQEKSVDAPRRNIKRPPRPSDDPDDPGFGGAGGSGWGERSADESFEPIKQIVDVNYDPVEHEKLAALVRPHSHRLRAYLQNLGKGYDRVRFRTSGRRFDRHQAAALVLRRDPRVMTSRQLKLANDLFLSVLVDCSGSMSGERLERAKLFAALISESARGVFGIDVRNFGFTDRTIFDAGDAKRCAIHGLHSEGGNNDSGALWHAAKTAIGSRRRAKVLVMISDGTPSDCTVASLRGLVRDLTRRHRMICAQVAVAPLSDICFPYYVELDVTNLQSSVRRFGAIVTRLVKEALATS